MTIKKIKQLFCFHDYQYIEHTYFCGCLEKDYYRCTKCGKIMCEIWKWSKDEDGNNN